MGEASEGDFDSFRSAVLKRSRVNAAELSDGVVELESATGRRVKMKYGPELANYQVWRDGSLHDWKEHAKFVYRNADDAAAGPIRQEWLGGTLEVKSGSQAFQCTVDESGSVTFTNH